MAIFKNLWAKASTSRWWRKYVYSDPRFQLVAMSLPRGTSIGQESHEVTQSFFFIKGRAVVLVGTEVSVVTAGDVIVVPPGVVHNVTATEATKLLTIYAPIEHPLPTRDERVKRAARRR